MNISDQHPTTARLALGLGAAVMAISSAAVVIRALGDVDAALVGGGRVTVTGAVLFALAPRVSKRTLTTGLTERALGLWMLLASLLLALHFATWIASFRFTTVLRSVTLVSLQPLFAALIGVLGGEAPPVRLYLGTLIALGGLMVLLGNGATLDPGWWATSSDLHEMPAAASLFGDLLALFAGFAVAAYLAVGRKLRDRVPLQGYLASIHLLAAVPLLALTASGLLAPAVSSGTAGHAAKGVALLLGILYLGLGPGICGHGLINWAVRHLPVHAVSLVVLLEPVGASLLAWALLGESIAASEAVGAGILLSGVALGLPRPDRRPRTQELPNSGSRLG